jgi:N-acetylmuramoyl-L-alanine amidase
MAKRIICIDPGHGGYDPGACAGGAQEKDITLHIGLQLRDLLRSSGFSVVMTRDADTSPGGYKEVNADLRERCRISNAAGADLFLSIHVNAGGGHGAEIYADGDGGPIAGLLRGIIDKVSTICGTHGQAVRDGGTNDAGWRVITGTAADAMLLEIGFIDSTDLQKIQAHIDEFAPLIARAFCNFYGVDYPNAAPKFDLATVNDLLPTFGQLYGIASTDAQVAYNYASNALRRAVGIRVDTDLGTPTRAAAEQVISVLGALWKPGKAVVREALNYAANALRDVVGTQKQ